MDFLISANTDIGISRHTNQDSFANLIVNTPQGRMAFTVLCDGMGGLAEGEVASASVTNAFRYWAINILPKLCETPLEDSTIRSQWEKIVAMQNQEIKNYGTRRGISLGTTAVVMLLSQTRYFIMNIGDSRAYEITSGVRQITIDQTFVAREIAMGHMTEAQATVDPRRNILLQCIGASKSVYPDMFFGDVCQNAVYMLCSDGFRHEITEAEIYEKLRPNILMDEQVMQQNTVSLIELNKQRMERDNISVALVRTF